MSSRVSPHATPDNSALGKTSARPPSSLMCGSAAATNTEPNPAVAFASTSLRAMSFLSRFCNSARSLPDDERAELQKRLKKLIARKDVLANATAGLGSVFVAAADPHIKDDGGLALVLPKALLSGVAWGETRELINRKYQIEFLVASQDPERWNFSESTDLSEVLLVARKLRQNASPDNTPVVGVNLWRNPTTSFEALAIAQVIITQN